MGNILNIVLVPFGALMKFLYGISGNYALTLLLFTVAVQIVLIPFGIKQQRSQIRMAKIRPKEQVIRKKYAGRTDTATQQKMQQEVMNMYKQENYSPMSGCLPMLIQLPIILALYNIVRHPLTYIAGFSSELVNRLKEFMLESSEFLPNMTDIKQIQEIDVVKVLMDNLQGIKSAVDLTGIADAGKFLEFQNMDFSFFNQSLLTAPSEAIFSVLMLIPILNFAGVFLQTRLTKKLQANSALNDAANNRSMKIMEYTMPLMMVYFTYIMSSALGLYWIYRTIASIVQMIVMSKILPIPAPTDEELKLAQEQYGGTAKKKKKKKPAEISGEEQGDEDESENKLEKISKKPENILKNTKEIQMNDDIYNDGKDLAENNSSGKSGEGDSYIEQRDVESDEKNEVSQKKGEEKENRKTLKRYTVKRRNSSK